jgi:hypothetical protein
LRYEDFDQVRTAFRKAHDALVRCLTRADKWALPRLVNLKQGKPLGHFLFDRDVIKGLRPTAQRLTARWIGRFLGQLGEVQERVRRIHFKSLGGILALQEELREKWLAELPRWLKVETEGEALEEVADEPPPEPGRPGRLRHQRLD